MRWGGRGEVPGGSNESPFLSEAVSSSDSSWSSFLLLLLPPSASSPEGRAPGASTGAGSSTSSADGENGRAPGTHLIGQPGSYHQELV